MFRHILCVEFGNGSTGGDIIASIISLIDRVSLLLRGSNVFSRSFRISLFDRASSPVKLLAKRHKALHSQRCEGSSVRLVVPYIMQIASVVCEDISGFFGI